MSERAMSTPAEIVFRTDAGRDPDKQVNEDAAASVETPLGTLAIVCDGMGGHAGGKEASELAVRTIVEITQAATPSTAPAEALRVAIEEANRRVWSMPTDEAGYRPGSTVVAALVHAGGAEIAHVGDSRAYLVHAGAISQVTKDHSMVQEMVERNLIRPEEAANHPDANKILRALGIAKEVDVDVRPTPLPYVAGDLLVLCSDGLSDLVNPSEILEVAGSTPAAQAAGQLVDLANARGGHDNITVMIVCFKATAESREAATIVKTMQLTAHEPPPAAAAASAPRASGPKGTLLSTPAHEPPRGGGSSGTAPLAPLPDPMAAAAPVAPIPAPAPSTPRPSTPERSRGPILVGIGLAVVALVILGVLFWNERRPQHHTPLLVDDITDAGASGTPGTTIIDEGDDAEPEPVVTPSPPLSPSTEGGAGAGAGTAAPAARTGAPATAAPSWWPKDDAGARPPELADCDRAQRAKARGLPPSAVVHLEERCRAAGGTP